MRTLKLLKDFQGHKAGDLIDVKETDAAYLIDEGIAAVHIEAAKHTVPDPDADPPEDPVEAAAKAAVEIIKASGALTPAERVPAQPKGEPKGYNFQGRSFYDAVKNKDMGVLAPYCQFRDDEAKAATGHSVAIDSDGGFLVPTEMSNDIVAAQTNAARLAPQCSNTEINNRIERPFVDDYDKSSSWFAGFQTYWVSEAQAPTKSKIKLGKYALQLKKVGVVTYGTEELLADSPQSFEALLSQGAGYSLAKEFDEQIVNGGGAGLPLGLMNSGALVTIAKESGQVHEEQHAQS